MSKRKPRTKKEALLSRQFDEVEELNPQKAREERRRIKREMTKTARALDKQIAREIIKESED